MPSVTITGWVPVPGAAGYYGFAGPAPGLYPHRSLGPAAAPPISVPVPTEGMYYVAVCGFVVVEGVEVYGPLSEPITAYTTAGPQGVLILAAG